MLLASLFLVILGSLGVSNGIVSAHTGFESSTPANGATVTEPVNTVVVTFTAAAAAAGEGFAVLDASGQMRMPTSIDVAEERIFTLTFDPPLSGGTIGLRWSVAAPDAHPIDGSFSFSTPAAITADLTSDDGALASAEVVPAAESMPPLASMEQDMAAFLEVDNSRPGEATARIGRMLGLTSLVLVLGLIVFLATTLVGRLDELRASFTTIRVLGGALALGALIEYIGVSRIGGGGVTSTWTTAAGFSTMLRFVGGFLLTLAFIPTIKRVRTASPSLSAAVLEAPRRTLVDHEYIEVEQPQQQQQRRQSAVRRRPERSQLVRWMPDEASWTLAAASAAILMSFWFDGHTVSKGPRLLHAVFNSVHVAAGSVWAGGVLSLAAVLWLRHLNGEPGRAHEMVVRFSGVATIALGAVAFAGLVMAVFVLDSFGELTGTVWGKVLLLKTAAVALASAGGAYNHFILLPALDADPDNPELQAEVRSTVTAEGIMMIFVVIVTAWLVAAAS